MLSIIFIIFSVIFFMCLSAGILFFLFGRSISFQKKVDSYFTLKETQGIEKEPLFKKKQRKRSTVLQTYWLNGTELINKKTSSTKRKKLELLIREAGFSSKFSSADFRLFQLLLSIGGFLFTILLLSPMVDEKSMLVLLAFAICFLGYRYPLFFLSKKKSKRIKQINVDMPDFFDTVNLLIEAGNSLDAAITTVCHKGKGPLSEEFLITLEDMKLGKTRREAFYELRRRVPSEPLQSVLASLIQADHLGVGMAKVLKNLTTRIREQRREAAREQAMKAPVKMLFPMVIFIFPSLFIVILGPMIIKLLTTGW